MKSSIKDKANEKIETTEKPTDKEVEKTVKETEKPKKTETKKLEVDGDIVITETIKE